MISTFESLESRTLFAASGATILASVTQIQADITALQTGLQAGLTTYRADAAALAVDTAALPKTPANRRLIAKFKGDANRLTARSSAAANKVEALASAKTEQRVTTDGTAVLLNASDTKARARLAADIARLQRSAAGPTAKLTSVLSTAPTTLTADLAALVAANPTDTTLATDAGTAGSDLSATVTSVTPGLTQTRTDLATLLAALRS